MKNWRQVDKDYVWFKLQEGKPILVAILESKNFYQEIINLRWVKVENVNKLLKEENVVFFEKIKEE